MHIFSKILLARHNNGRLLSEKLIDQHINKSYTVQDLDHFIFVMLKVMVHFHRLSVSGFLADFFSGC